MHEQTRSRKPSLVRPLENVHRRPHRDEVSRGPSRPLVDENIEPLGATVRVEELLPLGLEEVTDTPTLVEVEEEVVVEDGIEEIASSRGQSSTFDTKGAFSAVTPIALRSRMADPGPQIDPLVRPRGLPIVVPRDLEPASIPSNLPKFSGSRDEDPSLHMERYIEVLSSSLVVNPGYYLVWFPTTLQGEAYDWYRDHGEGHFVAWPELQVEFLNHFRPEVGQSAALRAVSAVKQGKDEDISSYLRRFELVCTRFVGNMLNDDTLKQFFIQGFFTGTTIKGILERNPATLEQAKLAARQVDAINKSYDRLWRKEDESIPHFIPINPRQSTVNHSASASVPFTAPGEMPQPLATREPEPLLSLTHPEWEQRLEGVEKKMMANQEGFQNSMLKQLQTLTDQMTFMVKGQGARVQPPPIESGSHASGMWCTNCGQSGHSAQFCALGPQENAMGFTQPQTQNPPWINRDRNQGYNHGGYRIKPGSNAKRAQKPT